MWCSLSDWRIGPRIQVKRGKKCLVGQFCQWNSYWRRLAIKFSHEPEIVLQISWHPDTWTVNVDLNTDSKCVWTWKFWNPQRKICWFKNIWIRADGKGPKPSRHLFFIARRTLTTMPFIYCPWDKRFMHDQKTNSIEPSHVYFGHAIPIRAFKPQPWLIWRRISPLNLQGTQTREDLHVCHLLGKANVKPFPEAETLPLNGFILAKQSNSYLEKAWSKAIDLTKGRPTKSKLSPLHTRGPLPHSIYSYIFNCARECNRVRLRLTSVECNAILHYWSLFWYAMDEVLLNFLVSSRLPGSLFRIIRSWSRKRRGLAINSVCWALL